jgi:hypothetical protein
VDQARAHPDRTLARVDSLKKAKAAPPGDQEVRAGLAKLSAEDRRLAEAQKYCAIQESRLGTMGTPAKVVLNGRPVFLCCKGCARKALADPDRTLAKVEQLKARAGAAPEK